MSLVMPQLSYVPLMKPTECELGLDQSEDRPSNAASGTSPLMHKVDRSRGAGSQQGTWTWTVLESRARRTTPQRVGCGIH